MTPTTLEAAKHERDQPMRDALSECARRAASFEEGVCGFVVVVVLDDGVVDLTWEALGGVRKLTLLGGLESAKARILEEVGGE